MSSFTLSIRLASNRQACLSMAVCAVVALIIFCAPAVRAATVPAGFTDSQVAGDIAGGTAMAFATDGRLFVCQQNGQLRIIKDGVLLPTPFLTVATDSSGERGLLGVAFDPNFAANNYLYLYYTVATSPRHNRVSRFTANGDAVVPGSEVLILRLNDLSGATNHNGGAMHFGPDGKLYIAVGENANPAHAQTLGNLLGKMLRINADGSIPSDNPFFATATGDNRAIWALGLRNPFTFAFQPGGNRMFINDVGQGAWEEINDGVAGANFGWPTCEGNCNPANQNFRDPIYAYQHGIGPTTGFAITGGAFYNPAINQFPSQFVGKYFFADFVTDWINVLDPSDNTITTFATGAASPVDLQVGPDGALYYLSRGGTGSVGKILYTAAPAITLNPASVSVAAGQAATFTVAASGAPALAYQWQRNGADIPGATSATYMLDPVAPADNNARFRSVVTNSSGSATSAEATLTVLVAAAPSELRFSQTTHNANEGSRSIAIEVTRGGDLSTAATVRYATADQSALERKDYTTATGVLRFAPGESAKNITVFITDDAFVEANETFTVALSNPSPGTAIAAAGPAIVTIIENDATQTINPILDNGMFVRQHYVDFLNREPEADGFNAWVQVLARCDRQGQMGSSDPTCDRVEVSSSFFRSQEFQLRGYFIHRFYEAALGRRPTYQEFLTDLSQLSGAQTPEQQESNKAAFVVDFSSRAEFKARYDAAVAPTTYVNAILGQAQVTLANRDAIIADLTANRATRETALRAVMESPEVYEKFFKSGFVTMQYFGYLRRDPEQDGYDAWLRYLNANPLDFRTMVWGFVYSIEYQQRFGNLP